MSLHPKWASTPDEPLPQVGLHPRWASILDGSPLLHEAGGREILWHFPGIQPIQSFMQGLLPESLAGRRDVGGGAVSPPVGEPVGETQRLEADPAMQTQSSSCCLAGFTQDGDKCLGCPSAWHSGL